jgi:hypothetical protein
LLLAGAGYDVYHATIPSQDDYWVIGMWPFQVK